MTKSSHAKEQALIMLGIKLLRAWRAVDYAYPSAEHLACKAWATGRKLKRFSPALHKELEAAKSTIIAIAVKEDQCKA